MAMPLMCPPRPPIVLIRERSERRTLLVGIQDGDQRDFGQIEALAQQV